LNKELAELLRLRSVLNSVSSGRGVSASIVRTLAGGERGERSAARMVLLGHPPSVALAPLTTENTRELAMLTGLIANVSTASAKVLGRKGEALSNILENWLKAKETRAMERRVMQARGYVMCAVLGAVMAIMSTLGPVVGSISFLQSAPPTPSPYLGYASGAMVAFSSSMLGIFLGGRRFYINLAIAGVVFLLGTSAAAPLASFPVSGLWAIK
jgi:hypothetical protein